MDLGEGSRETREVAERSARTRLGRVSRVVATMPIFFTRTRCGLLRDLSWRVTKSALHSANIILTTTERINTIWLVIRLLC